MEAGEQEKIEHLSKKDQITFESAVEETNHRQLFSISFQPKETILIYIKGR